MRLVVQRVSSVAVQVRGIKEVKGKIARGLFVLVGIKKGDSLEEARALAEKLSKLRVMPGKSGKMNLVANELLVVSQFTLYADTKKGNRPSFIKAAEPKEAQVVYDYFVEALREKDLKVETGSFGAYMDIKASLDGPVTIILES